jgi:transcriptional regulator with XRE-family HTH domain
MAKTRPQITQAIRQSRYWTAEDAATVLAAAAESGLSVREFAARNGLVPQRLERWQRKLASARPSAATFVEIAPVLAGSGVRASASGFEVVLRSGRVVRVGAGFDAGELRRLLAVVDEASC